MENLSLIYGDCMPGLGRHVTRENVVRVLHEARDAGYTIGRTVVMGAVAGTIIGYNIGDQGLYYASRFPLLVETPYGVIKCNPDELRLSS